jgi:hypothetical protein
MSAAPETSLERANGKAMSLPPAPERTMVAKLVAPADMDASASAALPILTLPYMEFSHALMRTVDVRAMTAANRKLTDAVRQVLRRQQDLAWDLAERTLNSVGLSAGAAESNPGEVFDRAAAAVRELGEALIDAQIGALRTLQSETDNPGDDR